MMDPSRVRNHMETYYGQVKSPSDAIILFEACRQGVLPRVQRRLSEKERQQIRSGSVFVWDEREAGMRRWTDGKSWSASRVSGSFLTYREMEGKKGGGSNGGSPQPSAPLEHTTSGGSDPADGMDGYRYKPDGLVKQSFSISTSAGQHLHLISYFSRSHPASANIPSPTGDGNLRHIRPAKGMYPESTVHDAQSMPAVTRSPMGESSIGDGANGYSRHPQAPQFGFPPTPGTPTGMNGSWPGSYFPYGFPGNGFPPSGFPGMPNGIPAAWAAAWFAQMQMWQQQQQQQMQHSQQQNQSQSQQQGQQQQNGGSDRAPPATRGNPPPPPPAPAQSYPHLLHQNNSQSASNNTPYISPLRNGDQTPSYQNSTTFQAHQAQYQAWLERQKQNQSDSPQQSQAQDSRSAQGHPHHQSQATPSPAYSAHGYGPVQNGYSSHQQPQPQSQSRPQAQPDQPPRPNLNHTTSSASIPSTPTTDTTRKIIPSINSLMSSSQQVTTPQPSATATAPPSASHSHPHLQPQPQSQPRNSQTYPYAKISPAPPPAPQQQQQPQRMPDSQEPSGGNGGQGGYGADMNALRRLDRAFAP